MASTMDLSSRSHCRRTYLESELQGLKTILTEQGQVLLLHLQQLERKGVQRGPQIIRRENQGGAIASRRNGGISFASWRNRSRSIACSTKALCTWCRPGTNVPAATEPNSERLKAWEPAMA